MLLQYDKAREAQGKSSSRSQPLRRLIHVQGLVLDVTMHYAEPVLAQAQTEVATTFRHVHDQHMHTALLKNTCHRYCHSDDNRQRLQRPFHLYLRYESHWVNANASQILWLFSFLQHASTITPCPALLLLHFEVYGTLLIASLVSFKI